MRKKGFTLIELVISIAIITIIFAVSISLSKMNSRIYNDIRYESLLYEIEDIISYSKAYCKNNNTSGEIQIDNKLNEISFSQNDDKKIKKVTLPKDINLIVKNEILNIGSNGHIKNGLCISVEDKYHECYDITIRVGVDLVTIKKK
ncbi:prepilin-type N-terminal cleavage/methylation domain-containing protein [Clostridium weizhouense]|uniref:Prepilin-type N-terminal cleavage/methylation domain-containing protein n=1 Tax=Clostridium weizhouense TaxID=2859781 RepID=A0ABS7AQI5_9CLOT|nr:prepilin-type N-terminal cleavage/methylation domain-containing protein [Clostridium weizhouense]MBW6410928.1 prepilin-type N-terminal cleavage/methylation domain-containing protein [Clostridium weizhouense]